jgi:hypothetical protein
MAYLNCRADNGVSDLLFTTGGDDFFPEFEEPDGLIEISSRNFGSLGRVAGLAFSAPDVDAAFLPEEQPVAIKAIKKIPTNLSKIFFLVKVAAKLIQQSVKAS